MPYRTGKTVPNTFYDGDVFIGSAITGHKAAQLVEAANAWLALCPACQESVGKLCLLEDTENTEDGGAGNPPESAESL